MRKAQEFLPRPFLESRGQDLNLRPSGYEPDELPGCSTPQSGLVEQLNRAVNAPSHNSTDPASKDAHASAPA